MIARYAVAAAFSMVLVVFGAGPVLAMHWSIYAPDEAGYRYWIDRDSIQTRGDYVYFTYRLLGEDSTAPTTPDGDQSAINCKTGDSLELDNGNWVSGPHFTGAAYLYQFVCPK